jgi:hypothetical protein
MQRSGWFKRNLIHKKLREDSLSLNKFISTQLKNAEEIRIRNNYKRYIELDAAICDCTTSIAYPSSQRGSLKWHSEGCFENKPRSNIFKRYFIHLLDGIVSNIHFFHFQNKRKISNALNHLLKLKIHFNSSDQFSSFQKHKWFSELVGKLFLILDI